MEQQPGQDPEHDGPAGPQPGPGSPGPADAGLPGDAAPSRALPAPPFRRRRLHGVRAVAAASGCRLRLRLRFRSPAGRLPLPADGDGDGDGECVFGPWDALEGTLGAAKEREELLSGFAPGGVWDKHPPGPELAAALAQAAGPDWRCAWATGEELIGLLRAMAALQSWAGAGLLGVVRALIRDDDPPFLGRSGHGDLPDGWDDSLVQRSPWRWRSRSRRRRRRPGRRGSWAPGCPASSCCSGTGPWTCRGPGWSPRSSRSYPTRTAPGPRSCCCPSWRPRRARRTPRSSGSPPRSRRRSTRSWPSGGGRRRRSTGRG